jgi:hypothetical protein
MKFILIIVLSLISSMTLAQNLEIEIGGVRHSCTPLNSGNGRFSCIEAAVRGPFSTSEVERICEGAYSDAPARCAIRAYRGFLTKDESLNLCGKALSEGPIECVEVAYRGPYTRSEALELCSNPRASVQNAQCAMRAYQGAYSREESIRLCKAQYNYGQKMLSIQLINKNELEKLIHNVNLKAFQLNDYK